LLSYETIARCLDILLSAGAGYADLFAEKGRFFSSESDDRKISSSIHHQIGVGIRAVKDNVDYYMVCENFAPDNLIQTTSLLASGIKTSASGHSVNLSPGFRPLFYKPETDHSQVETEKKLEILKKSEDIAWHCSKKIKQATIRYADFERNIQFASTADEEVLEHKLALVEFMVFVYAGDNGERQLGWNGRSFYRGLEALVGEDSPESIVRKACTQAEVMLEARDCPAGEMPVVFAPGSNGVLFHESCGHGMEADLVQKGSSFAGMLNHKVASDKVTIRDSGLIFGYPGSYAFDDEGVDSQETTLIENGRLINYIHSRNTARQMKMSPTGSGRRQSLAFPPMPRMRNTYIVAGNDDPEEIIRSTKKGLYAVDVGFGGEVDVVTGRFITSIVLGYMIEDGKLTYPVKGATITGLGIKALQDIDMVGNDLVMDPSPGRCGKGQDVPVGVGMPTIRVKKLLVGGKGMAI
jgi:TldD protein